MHQMAGVSMLQFFSAFLFLWLYILEKKEQRQQTADSGVPIWEMKSFERTEKDLCLRDLSHSKEQNTADRGQMKTN